MNLTEKRTVADGANDVFPMRELLVTSLSALQRDCLFVVASKPVVSLQYVVDEVQLTNGTDIDRSDVQEALDGCVSEGIVYHDGGHYWTTKSGDIAVSEYLTVLADYYFSSVEDHSETESEHE